MEPEQTPHPDGETAAGTGGLPHTPDDAPAAGDHAAADTPDAAAVGTGATAGTPGGAAPDTVGQAASPVTTVLDTVSAQIVQLQTAPTLTLSDNELRTALIAAHRLTNQLEAATLHLVRALDDRPEAMPTCPAGKVAATFLVHALRVDPGTAAHDVAAARRLDPDGAGVGIDTGSTNPTGGLDATAMGLPEVGAALAAGDISRRHVDHAVGCVGRIDGDVLAHIDPAGIAGIQRVDEFLAEQARKHAPHVFRRLCTQLEEALNPDKGFDPKAHEKRYLHLGTDATGMLVGRFALSPADGLIVRNVLHALSKPIKPTASTAGGGAEGGGGQVQGELPLRDPRTAAQRRADALAHLARLALRGNRDTDTDTDDEDEDADAACGTSTGGVPQQPTDGHSTPTTADNDTRHRNGDGDGDGDGDGAASTTAKTTTPATRRTPTPPPAKGIHISLIATLDQLTAALRPLPTPGAGLGSDLGPGGGPLPRHVLAQMLCTSLISPTILDGDGAVLAQGRAQRLATPAQRRAVFARDRGCVIPGCTAPVDWCDVHHAVPWADGGLTDVDAMVAACGRDHTAIHAGIWTITMINGVPWVIPPPWIDPLQRPVRNTIHDDEHTAHRLAAHLGDQIGDQLELGLNIGLDLNTELDLDTSTVADPCLDPTHGSGPDQRDGPAGTPRCGNESPPEAA